MKVYYPLKQLHVASSARGIGVYTRELLAALHKRFPHDHFLTAKTGKKSISADLVHYPYFDPFALTLKIGRALPTIITVHDLIPIKFSQHFRLGWRGKLKWQIQKARARKASHILTDSQCSKNDIVEILKVNPAKVSVVPLGPNRSQPVQTRMTKKIAASYHLPQKYLLYVGDINWNKNVVGLVNAFTQLRDPDLHLVMVGKVFADAPDIPEFREIESAVLSSGKADSIHRLGYVPSHHLSVLYSLATLYVQPSWYEGFGLPVLEAMKFGCPVACSNRGSLPEIGGEAVAYFDPAKNMQETISQLLASPQQRAELANKGLTQASLFTWDQTAKLTYAVYQQVLTHHFVS